MAQVAQPPRRVRGTVFERRVKKRTAYSAVALNAALDSLLPASPLAACKASSPALARSSARSLSNSEPAGMRSASAAISWA